MTWANDAGLLTGPNKPTHYSDFRNCVVTWPLNLTSILVVPSTQHREQQEPQGGLHGIVGDFTCLYWMNIGFFAEIILRGPSFQASVSKSRDTGK